MEIHNIEDMQEIWVKSTVDDTMQPSLFYESKQKNSPLLVGLHTWSCDRFNQVERMMPLAKKNGWNLLLPEFRGANLKSNSNCIDACGSLKAKQDILDAVDYVVDKYSIDAQNILLLGASGGGHMALLMAAYAPKMWRAVSSFVPITDLEKWYEESDSYREHIAACCGGEPRMFRESEVLTNSVIKDMEIDLQYKFRSPIHYVKQISQATVKIYTGKRDPIVPSHHGLDLYNLIYNQYPEADVYFEMFDGGHEMILEKAESWLLTRVDRTKRQQETVTG